ncbi:SURF1 family protein [Endozoicomonas ascidiicola]|uniref:SURF1 family protein n=1 Tax=Endozoicomonas ascidiicola TaxID=1698521 RepID=UPI0012F8A33E|nr:SURF1 family protein [Endozoicomonas ascidiicola]
MKLTLLVIALLPVLLYLGFWQLSRYEQKLQLEQTYQSRQHLEPVTFSQARQFEDPLYLPLEVSGRYDPERYFFLDNQIYQQQAGYDLFMPFHTDSGQWLLINRGWLPAGDRSSLPYVETDKSHLTLKGIAYKPLGEAFLLGEDIWEDGWPKRIQSINLAKMSQAINQATPDFFLILNTGESGSKRVRPSIMNMTSEKHRGYAFQWFAMALVLLALYGYQMIRAGKKHNKNNDA